MRIVFFAFVAVLSASLLTSAFNIKVAKASTIVVPDDFPSIQEAINNANGGDIVYVRAGTYYENVVVNKSLSLIGENRNSTIIDGLQVHHAISIQTSNVLLEGFTIRNGIEGVYMYREYTNNTIRNNIVTNNTGRGISLWWSHRNNMIDNIVTNNVVGIFLYWCAGDNITNNILMNNSQSGISMEFSGTGLTPGGAINLLENNLVVGGQYGIDLRACDGNIIRGNNVTSSNVSICIYGLNGGNSVVQNIVTSSIDCGIEVFGSYSNIIKENIVADCELGFRQDWWHSGYNKIFHNNFVNNRRQAYFKDGYENTWDDRYPSGGNYWSDYNSTDLHNGPYQNETGSDGIRDIPYVIDANNQDNYPLRNPWILFSGDTICIRADGNVDPPDAPIERKEDVYTLTGDIFSHSDGIVVERNNVMIDGGGYIIRGSGDYTNGIEMSGRINMTVRNIGITRFNSGVFAINSENCTVMNSQVAGNVAEFGEGIYLFNCSGTCIADNLMVSNLGSGITLDVSDNNYINRNFIAYNRKVPSSYTGDGINFYASNNNTVTCNSIEDNEQYGIVVFGYSNNNKIFHNSFVDNPMQVEIWDASPNILDDGHPSAGNYWSNYDGSDSYFGPYQNLTGSDGIGDTPYLVDANNADHYPLMSPYEYWSNPILGDLDKDMKVDMGDIAQLCDGFGSVNGSSVCYWHKPACTLCPHCSIGDINFDGKIDMGDLVMALDHFGQHYTLSHHHAGIEEKMTNSNGQVTISFPTGKFTAAPSFSASVRICSGAEAGGTAKVAYAQVTADNATFTVQYWDGASFSDLGPFILVQVSYVAVE